MDRATLSLDEINFFICRNEFYDTIFTAYHFAYIPSILFHVVIFLCLNSHVEKKRNPVTSRCVNRRKSRRLTEKNIIQKSENLKIRGKKTEDSTSSLAFEIKSIPYVPGRCRTQRVAKFCGELIGLSLSS